MCRDPVPVRAHYRRVIILPYSVCAGRGARIALKSAPHERASRQSMTQEFLLPADYDPQALQTDLPGGLKLSEPTERELRRYLLDSFDWRLFAAGCSLVADELAPGYELQFSSAGRRVAIRMAKLPRFAWDLPAGILAERLGELLEMRALMQRVALRTQRREWRILDRHAKTVARLRLESHAVAGETDAGLAPRLSLLPVKGYDHVTRRLRAGLEAAAGVVPAPSTLFVAACRSAGVQPGDYSAKPDLRFDPRDSAADALRAILRRILEVMRRNEAGLVADIDSEFLHDFRVAVRRTRSALTQVKGVLPQRQVEHFRQEFAWLGGVTGPTRDLDVYLLKFPVYQSRLPREIRPDLQPLHAFLLRHQGQEHRRLCAQLAGGRYARLMDEWQRFLDTAPTAQEAPVHAARPIRDVAAHRIWKNYRRVLREGLAIDRHSPAKALHELRKSCKKLRYLMEFFQSLFPRDQVRILIKALKRLQENLGDFQDLEVQVDHLRAFGLQMQKEQNVSAATLMAMGMLVERLTEAQQLARAEFAERFTEFAESGNRALFAQLFRIRSESPA